MILKSSFFNYSDVHILVKENITINKAGADAAAWNLDARNKQVIFKNYATFTNCISKINNT